MHNPKLFKKRGKKRKKEERKSYKNFTAVIRYLPWQVFPVDHTNHKVHSLARKNTLQLSSGVQKGCLLFSFCASPCPFIDWGKVIYCQDSSTPALFMCFKEEVEQNSEKLKRHCVCIKATQTATLAFYCYYLFNYTSLYTWKTRS